MWKNKCHVNVVGKSDQNVSYTVLHTRGQVQKVSHSLNLMNVMQRLKPNLPPQCSRFYTSWSRETFSFSFSRICCVWNKTGDVAARPQTAESIQPDPHHHVMTCSCCIKTASKLCPASPPWWQLDIRQLSAGVLMHELLHRGVTWESQALTVLSQAVRRTLSCRCVHTVHPRAQGKAHNSPLLLLSVPKGCSSHQGFGLEGSPQHVQLVSGQAALGWCGSWG